MTEIAPWLSSMTITLSVAVTRVASPLMNFHAKICQCVLWRVSEPPVSVTNSFHIWALFWSLVTASSIGLGLPYFAEVCPAVSSTNAMLLRLMARFPVQLFRWMHGATSEWAWRRIELCCTYKGGILPLPCILPSSDVGYRQVHSGMSLLIHRLILVTLRPLHFSRFRSTFLFKA